MYLEAGMKLLKKVPDKFDPTSRKAWFELIKIMNDPYFIETLIIQLEARKKQLNADKDFKSEYVG